MSVRAVLARVGGLFTGPGIDSAAADIGYPLRAVPPAGSRACALPCVDPAMTVRS